MKKQAVVMYQNALCQRVNLDPHIGTDLLTNGQHLQETL